MTPEKRPRINIRRKRYIEDLSTDRRQKRVSRAKSEHCGKGVNERASMRLHGVLSTKFRNLVSGYDANKGDAHRSIYEPPVHYDHGRFNGLDPKLSEWLMGYCQLASTAFRNGAVVTPKFYLRTDRSYYDGCYLLCIRARITVSKVSPLPASDTVWDALRYSLLDNEPADHFRATRASVDVFADFESTVEPPQTAGMVTRLDGGSYVSSDSHYAYSNIVHSALRGITEDAMALYVWLKALDRSCTDTMKIGKDILQEANMADVAQDIANTRIIEHLVRTPPEALELIAKAVPIYRLKEIEDMLGQ